MAEAKDLKSFQCGFESRLPYQRRPKGQLKTLRD